MNYHYINETANS